MGDANSEFNDILRLSVKVLFRTVAALALMSVLFLFMFPYSAMRFYNGLDMRERALGFAEDYVQRNEKQFTKILPDYNSKYTDALFYCVTTSVSLMNNSVKECGVQSERVELLAKKVDKYTDSFMNYDLTRRIEMIDTYSINNTLPSFQPYVYSFKDDIIAAQIRARIFSNKRVDADAVILEKFEGLKSPSDDDFVLNDLRQMSEIMAYVSSYIRASALIGDVDRMTLLCANGEVTNFYLDFSDYIEQAKEFVLNETESAISVEKYLQKLYCFRRLAEVSEEFNELSNSSFLANIGFNSELWESLNLVQGSNGEQVSLNEYFMLTLLYNYSKMF